MTQKEKALKAQARNIFKDLLKLGIKVQHLEDKYIGGK